MPLTAAVPTDPSLFRTPLDVIQRAALGTGTRGQRVQSDYLAIGTIRALVRLLSNTSGKKMEICRQLVPTATHLVVTHYNPLLTDRVALRLGTRIFNIGHVDNVDEGNFENQMICIEQITPDEG